ncbi:MAG: type II toxin-antitoxin system RelE/ParE family toxin [Flavobacteriaceae bacterium]|nr:MAG: type II toxin-antitoxin system RelE/ParE family toxin [Flavobacteriaceae bacterium]
MGSKKLELTIDPEAQIEIDKAIENYEKAREGLGEEFYYYLDGYFEVLREDNVFFNIKRKPAFRELPLKRFPYVIIYEHTKTEIYVFSVFNTNQDPAKKRH